MFLKTLSALAALITVSACDEPVAATQNVADFDTAFATFGDLINRPLSSAPSGGGTYNGKITANAIIADEGGYQIVGNLGMNIDFSRSGANLAGTVTDINLIDTFNSAGTQRMTNGDGANGSLTVAGSRSGSTVSANATGRLGAVLLDNEGNSSFLETRADIDWTMTGRVRTTNRVSDTVIGTFDGTGTATSVNGMSVLVSGGEFFGTN
jgi:hypothetical protein